MTNQNTQNYGPGDFQNVPVIAGNYNSQPRQQCAVILDLSGSMLGSLDEVNKGLAEFYKGIQSDAEALYRVEFMLLGFGTDYKVLREFDTLSGESAPVVDECLGGTVFCPPINFAIQECYRKRMEFANEGIVTGKPVIIFISDGGAADSRDLPKLGEEIRFLMNIEDDDPQAKLKKIFFQAFGVEGANMDHLNELSDPRKPALPMGNAENFADMFRKLSNKVVNKSKEINQEEEQPALNSFQLTLS